MSERLTWAECLTTCVNTPSLVAEYDRLRGTNLSLRGTPIELMIDNATGRLATDFAYFVAFVYECVWTRLPEDAIDASTFPLNGVVTPDRTPEETP